MIACLNSNIENMRLILNSSQDHAEAAFLANLANSKQKTPLHAACLVGNIEIVNALITAGADMHKTDIKKFLPLHYAVVKDHSALISYFFERQKLKLLEP